MMSRSAILFLAFLWPVAAWAAQGVVNTLHNLSSTSGPPGRSVKSATVDRVCVFCHTPHSGAPHSPLWNRNDSGTTYLEYGSTTLNALPGQPTGKSRLCLSCHDGTVALGALVSSARGRPGRNDMLARFLQGSGNLTTDLRDDHPISFQYDAALQGADQQLADPTGIGLPLEDGALQCTTCHDVHDSTLTPFLRKTVVNSQLCTTCHVKNTASWSWATSSHATSTATPSGSTPWPERKATWSSFSNVKEGGCLNCHATHHATTPTRLVKGDEEATCYLCHNGTVAAKNIEGDVMKSYNHPVDTTRNTDHDAETLENPLTMTLHAECADCHNPHGVASAPPMISFNPSSTGAPHTTPPAANARIVGVKGVDINGATKTNIDFQYELCFKCHGLPGKSACGNNRCSTATNRQMIRQDSNYNIRDRVNSGTPGLVSYHPIESNNASNNSEVPSLRTDIPLNKTSSLIYCTDCHGGTASPAAGGTDANGPHGSSYEAILAQRYDVGASVNYSTSAYEVCFKCHSQSRLMNDVSGFPHKKHVDDERSPCIACHDPHGSNSTHLVNFLTSLDGTPLVTAVSGQSAPVWQDDGVYKGRCFLRCHGEDHNPENY